MRSNCIDELKGYNQNNFIMADIKHSISIKASSANIYELLVTKKGIQKWLTKEDGWKIVGKETLGDILFFHFGADHHELKISKLDTNKEVKWDCIFGHPDWISTFILFRIENKGDKNILHFEHNGWKSKTEFFNQCNQVWAGCVEDIKHIAEKR